MVCFPVLFGGFAHVDRVPLSSVDDIVNSAM